MFTHPIQSNQKRIKFSSESYETRLMINETLPKAYFTQMHFAEIAGIFILIF